MAEKYSSELLRIVIAQIAQTIGYSSTQSAPLELLEDILQRFIQELARDLHSQAEQANRVEPNLTDVLISLKNLSINVHELLDYIGNVEPVPFVRDVPAYPVKRNSHMNFLKPGSAETLTRPVHIFEYLPPMLPTDPISAVANHADHDHHNNTLSTSTLESNRELALHFGHKTADVKTDFVGSAPSGLAKWCSQNDSSARDNLNPDAHALREISSVVMTTGGFISPAIEGKLPEAFVPDIIEKFIGLDAPPAATPPPVSPEIDVKPNVLNDAVLEESPNAKRITVLESSARSERGEQDASTSINRAELNAGLGTIGSSIAVLPNTKVAKKSKNKHLMGGMRNEQNWGDLNVNKAQEKAQRKALKMYQKLSKGQVGSGQDGSSTHNIMGLKKKSMKNLNRGILSAVPDGSTERLQLEKMIKKQKQRQKHLKGKKQQQRQLQVVSKLSVVDGKSFAINSMAPVPIPDSASASNTDPEGIQLSVPHPIVPNIADNVLAFGVASNLIEKKEKFIPDMGLGAKGLPSADDLRNQDEIKLSSEPDTKKLNIFKKISKQKATKTQLSPSTINIAQNLFGNANNGSPLISLPSGTTITPAPALHTSSIENAKVNVIAPHNLNMQVAANMPTYGNDHEHPFRALLATVPYQQSPATAMTNNPMLIDVNKPKKRGRKPGGKNQARPQQASTTGTGIRPTIPPLVIHSPKKVKSSKLNAPVSYASNFSINPNESNPMLIPSTLPMPTEPLNLSHGDQLKSIHQLQHFSGNMSFGSAIGGSLDPAAAAVSMGNETVNAEILKFQKAKEKKERKKSKGKLNQLERDDNLKASSEQLFLMDTSQTKLAINKEMNMQISPAKTSPGVAKKRFLDTTPSMLGVHGFVGNGSGVAAIAGNNLPSSSSTIYPNNSANIMPMLPLLHFPPRPGLIPSGPGLFPPPNLSTFGKKVSCRTDSSMIMPHTFMPFPGAGIENNSTGLLGLLPMTDTNLERSSYCNVAPLVPDSMKLTSGNMDSSQLANITPELHVVESKLSHSTEFRGKEMTISKCMPVSQGGGLGSVGLHNDDTLSMTGQSPRSSLTIKSTTTAAGTGNLGDPIEVSDDSNEDESNANKIAFSLATNAHGTHALKSSIIQAPNLLNVQVQGLQQQFDSSHLYSMNANQLNSNTDSKQLKKIAKAAASLKMSQPHNDGNLLTPSTVVAPSTHPSPFNINFMGSDKFSLAGGADLIPLSRVDSGLAYSSETVPATSLAAGATSGSVPNHAPSQQADNQHFVNNFVGSVNYDDITITPTNSLSMSELKLRKLHKKLKKPKEGKIKKKKDKKDKTKTKDKNDDKNMPKDDKFKDKRQDKKMKKEKKKMEKQMTPEGLRTSKENLDQMNNMIASSGLVLSPVAVSVAVQETFPITMPQTALGHHLHSPKLDMSPNQVPKLTLKLSGKSTPTPTPFEADPESALSNSAGLTSTLTTTPTCSSTPSKREHSPELARFSPLVTGPPKPKQCEMQALSLSMATSGSASGSASASGAASAPVSAPMGTTQALPISMPMSMSISNTHAAGSAAVSSGWIPGIAPAVSATISASSVLLPQQLLQASKPMPKMPTAALPPSPSLVSPTKTEGASQSLPQSAESNRPSSYVDAEGYRIWICPACGKVDDGSAMIGCDGCDAWYHWTCVGIFVAPKDNEDWFCRVCVTKKRVQGSEKKKKRNKKK